MQLKDQGECLPSRVEPTHLTTEVEKVRKITSEAARDAALDRGEEMPLSRNSESLKPSYQ